MQREKETERKKERERDRRDFLIDIERTRSEQRLDRVKNIRVEGRDKREKEGDGNEAREEYERGKETSKRTVETNFRKGIFSTDECATLSDACLS